MTVIDHQPGAWFLLQDADSLLLDVRCSPQSFVDISIAIALEPEERESYMVAGHAFADNLATDIANRPQRFYSRRVSTAEEMRINSAIASWRNREI